MGWRRSIAWLREDALDEHRTLLGTNGEGLGFAQVENVDTGGGEISVLIGFGEDDPWRVDAETEAVGVRGKGVGDLQQRVIAVRRTLQRRDGSVRVGLMTGVA